jgi:hypothetical protein
VSVNKFSLEKTKEYLLNQITPENFDYDPTCDVICALRKDVKRDTINKIVKLWKQQQKEFIERWTKDSTLTIISDVSKKVRTKKIPGRGPQSYIFWDSELGYENFDAISRYLLMENFDINDFKNTQSEIESMFESEFLGLNSKSFVNTNLFIQDYHGIAFDLWLVSRSDTLSSRIRFSTNNALKLIDYIQNKDGSWPLYIPPEFNKYKKRLPSSDVLATALCCLVLLKLGKKKSHYDSAVYGINWLIKNQDPNGSWKCITDVPDTKLGYKTVIAPSLFATIIALETLKFSGLKGYNASISLAEAWITEQQKKDGSFGLDGLPTPLTTMLVYEYLSRKVIPYIETSEYLATSRDFIIRSIEFASEDYGTSYRLAIISAFHGVELFLYECLSDKSINLSIFNKNETIGMREALTKLESHFKSTKILKPNENIWYKNELMKMAYLRDEVVHKGANIGQKDANDLPLAAKKFVDITCDLVFGKHLFQ